MSKSLVFVSWSGVRAKAVATALVEWLPAILQSVEAWCSDGTDAGKSWSTEISNRLSAAKIGIIVVTPENLAQPWLLWEAGAIAKTLAGSPDDTRAIPYLFELEPKDISQPMSSLQAVKADLDGTKRVVRSVNRTLPEPLPDAILDKLFGRLWPDLEEKLAAAKVMEHGEKAPKKRTDTDVLAEVLDTVRRLDSTRHIGPKYLMTGTGTDPQIVLAQLERAEKAHMIAAQALAQAQERGEPDEIQQCQARLQMSKSMFLYLQLQRDFLTLSDSKFLTFA